MTGRFGVALLGGIPGVQDGEPLLPALARPDLGVVVPLNLFCCRGPHIHKRFKVAEPQPLFGEVCFLKHG